MIAVELTLSAKDMVRLRVTDAYSIHRVVYSLFEDTRSTEEKGSHEHSGFLYVDLGMKAGFRKILIVSDRAPIEQNFGTIRTKEIGPELFQYSDYRFSVVANATKRYYGKLKPILGREALTQWFTQKAPKAWGFDVLNLDVGQINVVKIRKQDTEIPIQQVQFRGVLHVTDPEMFLKTFQTGIGRGKAFGCGLLQILPIQ